MDHQGPHAANIPATIANKATRKKLLMTKGFTLSESVNRRPAAARTRMFTSPQTIPAEREKKAIGTEIDPPYGC